MQATGFLDNFWWKIAAYGSYRVSRFLIFLAKNISRNKKLKQYLKTVFLQWFVFLVQNASFNIRIYMRPIHQKSLIDTLNESFNDWFFFVKKKSQKNKAFLSHCGKTMEETMCFFTRVRSRIWESEVHSGLRNYARQDKTFLSVV